jgi:hypothetical protein
MALGPFVTYVPPGVYTRTLTEANAANLVAGLRIPVVIGVGQEELEQTDLELIRGSSSNLDQQILNENVSERFVVSEANPNNPTLGAADGTLTKLRVRNFPIVDGNGFGRTTNDVRSVSVSVNGVQVAVGAVLGSGGYITLQVPPQPGDDVRATYFFRRTDTAFTDNVSDQVTPTQAELVSPALAPFDVVQGVSDTLVLRVDDVEHTLTFVEGSYTAASMKTAIDSNLISGLATTVFTDGAGGEHITFIAAQKVEIGGGNANGIFGFTRGNASSRNAQFRVFQRPVVDGSDGGITTTDTSKVTVLVDGVQVIPTALDGTNGIVTLPLAPAPQSTVTINYFANTWQDTFDYLPNTLITNVVRCGFATGRNDFIEGQDFVVENPSPDVSIIHWGTSVSVTNTSATAGSTVFGDTQVLPTLVDEKIYMAATTPFVDTSQVPAVVSTTVFELPEIPTTGNGRDTPLGQDLYNDVANNRVGLPSNRPDLVQAWSGRDVYDALSRDPVVVAAVDAESRQITLREEVPVDHVVFATFNYNRIVDDQYNLTNKVSGAVGTGQYEVTSVVQNRNLHQIRFGNKAGLPEVVQWPRGVEQVPDAFHTGAGTPVSEVVTVTFGSTLANNARFTNDGAAPYNLFAGTSDQFRTDVNGTSFVVDLDVAAPAALVSSRIPVDGSDQIEIVTGENDEFNFTIDGSPVSVTLTPGTVTVTSVVAEINAAIDLVNDGTNDFTATAPNALAAFQRIGAAGGDHVITISGLNTPSALPDGFDEDYYVRVDQGSAETTLGFSAFQRADATTSATNKPATILGTQAGTFNITQDVDDQLLVQVDGVDYEVTLPNGAAVTSAAVVAAVNAVPGLANVASEGTGDNVDQVRLTSQTTDAGSRIVIKAGTANDVLGFTNNDEAGQVRVTAQEVVNVIMAFAGFVAEGFAYVNEINGQDYISIESITTGAATSSVAFVAGANSAFNTTTGMGIEPGTSGDNGEDAEDNFTVSSTNANGSGGTGIPGQTYTDERTGLRFTVLPSVVGSYTSSGSFDLTVSETWDVNPSVPYLSVPGIELVVTDTVGVGVNDVATVQTFNPGGLEPAISDSYFISYRYLKQDFSTQLYAQFKTIEAAFGPLTPENRVTLASYLMLLNGAVLVGIKQVLKEPNSNEASDQSYVEALNELKAPLPGNVRPDVIVPLSTSTAVYGATLQHVEVMSQTRNQSERMAYIGFASGTSPTSAQAVARGIESNRVVAVYPDSAVVTLTDELGNNVESLIDGTFLASAVAGSAVAPTFDVATPYTRRRVQGFTRLPRILDPVEANQTATAGITLLEDLDPIVRIRQGLTTDMSTILSRLPTVTQIADYVQQSARNTLDVFIGTKFLASRTNDVEVSLTSMFNQLVQAEIVGAFTGITAEVDPDDPTILRVEAFYQPIFPLLYIVVTFNLRARL